MSLDKAVEHHKEHRKPYYGAKAVDPACRNHGDDDWSLNNRLHQRRKVEQEADSKIKDWILEK